MPQKALKVVAELYVSAVTCPGVHLPAKDDICLSVCLMNQYRMSHCLPAVFPLLFRTKMTFDKIFKYASDPADVAEMLHCEPVKVELMQLFPPVGEVLAVYEGDARSFLFPEPKLVPSFSGGDREVLMTRDPTFPLAYDNSSDTDELHDNTKEPLMCNRLSGHEGSSSSVALSHTKMACPKLNSFFLYSPNSWEEVQERVRSLLTTPQAVYRLAYGATKSERDEVLERRSIS